MNNIINWFTKIRLTLVSLVGLLIFLILISKRVLFVICYTHNSICIRSINYLILFLLFGVVVFFISLSMFFVKQKTFESWKGLTFIYYLPIYLFVLILIPWYFGDEFLHIQKDIIALIISSFYFIFSLIFIIYKSFQKQ